MAVEYISLAQTSDMSDSEMVEHIQDFVDEGWELFDTQRKKCTIWTFQRETDK